MKLLAFVIILIFSFSANAEVGWLSVGGAYSTFSDMHPKQARELKYGQS